MTLKFNTAVEFMQIEFMQIFLLVPLKQIVIIANM